MSSCAAASWSQHLGSFVFVTTMAASSQSSTTDDWQGDAQGGASAAADIGWLPAEVLAHVLTATDSCVTLRADGRRTLPQIAAVCRSFHAAVLAGVRAVRLRHGGARSDGSTRAICARPAPVLSLSWPCDLQSSDVLSWARSVSASEVAARGLALHKCHSVHSVSIAPILRLTPRLLTLVITSQRLGTDGMEAVGRARHASLSRSRVCRSEVFADAHMPTRLPGG